jgi:hypothetical protein
LDLRNPAAAGGDQRSNEVGERPSSDSFRTDISDRRSLPCWHHDDHGGVSAYIAA